MHQKIVDLIIQTADDLRGDSFQLPDDMSADTPLFGCDGQLDSMALVTLIVAVEQAIEDEFDQAVALADEKALSEQNSPYRTIGSLAAYAEAQIED